jgi:hypothetical protein
MIRKPRQSLDLVCQAHELHANIAQTVAHHRMRLPLNPCPVKATYMLVAVILWAVPRPALSQPGPRQAHVLVYDERHRRIVLPAFREVWGWDGTRWEMLPGSAAKLRDLSAAAYDSRRGRIVSFGGRVRGTAVVVADTWEWDGADWRSQSDRSAEPRDHHVMAYDAARARVVMFGGSTFPRPEVSPSDTWEWDGKQWTRAAVSGPAGRITSLAYDARRRQVVLFGGLGDATTSGGGREYYGDTWVWDGHAWKKASETGPSPRSGHALAFDQRAGVVLLYGGFNARREYLADMWQWDGAQWTEIPLTGETPGRRTTHAMAYDPHRDRTVLYGGNVGREVFDDTWEWTGTRWTRVR